MHVEFEWTECQLVCGCPTRAARAPAPRADDRAGCIAEAEAVSAGHGATSLGIVGKAGQTVMVDSTAPFTLTFTQGISNVAACFINRWDGDDDHDAPTTTTTAPTTTTMAPSTSAGDTTTTAAGGGGSTLPRTGGGGNANVIGAAVLALLAGALALVTTRRRTA